jgi:hypothetical protein
MAILKWSWTPRRVCPQEQRRVGRRKGEGSESDWAAAPHCNSDARNQQAGSCGTTIQARAQSAGAFVKGKKRKKAGPPPHVTTTFAWVVNRRRASWQPTLLTCSSTTRSAGPAATFICFFRPAAAATCVCLFSRTSQPEKVRSQQHKLIVDLWPQLESFR